MASGSPQVNRKPSECEKGLTRGRPFLLKFKFESGSIYRTVVSKGRVPHGNSLFHQLLPLFLSGSATESSEKVGNRFQGIEQGSEWPETGAVVSPRSQSEDLMCRGDTSANT